MSDLGNVSVQIKSPCKKCFSFLIAVHLWITLVYSFLQPGVCSDARQ